MRPQSNKIYIDVYDMPGVPIDIICRDNTEEKSKGIEAKRIENEKNELHMRRTAIGSIREHITCNADSR